MDKLNDGFEKREHKLLGDFEKERQRLIQKNTHKVQRMTERFAKQEEETLQRFQTEIDQLKADHQREKGTVVLQLTYSLSVYSLNIKYEDNGFISLYFLSSGGSLSFHTYKLTLKISKIFELLNKTRFLPTSRFTKHTSFKHLISFVTVTYRGLQCR